MSLMENRVELPRFKARLKKYEKELSAGTYWRYWNGILPDPLGELFKNDPDLVSDLAMDLKDLSIKERESS